jgi:chemotaxis protein histidine kinase CheA
VTTKKNDLYSQYTSKKRIKKAKKAGKKNPPQKGSQFQRAEIKRAVAKQEPKTGDQQMAVSKQAQNALIKNPVPQDASNLDKLGALSSRVIQLAAQLKEIASDIDAAAIEIVEQKAQFHLQLSGIRTLFFPAYVAGCSPRATAS